MVFELSDIEVQSMNYTVGKHNTHVLEVANRYLDKKRDGQCTCPKKLESNKMRRYKEKLKKKNTEITYRRLHTNGYEINSRCPVHDLSISATNPDNT